MKLKLHTASQKKRPLSWTQIRTQNHALREEVVELHEREQNLKSELEVRDRFFSVVGHELRTPITSMKLALNLVTRLATSPKPDVVDLAEKVKRTEVQLERLHHLVDGLIDVARIRTQLKLELNRELFDLRNLAQEVIEQHKSQTKWIKVSFNVDLESSTGFWDPVRIEQVLNNLINNAIKYGRGKPITITLKNHQDFATLSVEDRGVGISPMHQETIFKCYERANEEAKIEGLGIGLFVVKEVIEAHSGSISVLSKIGHGSKFTIVLPKNVSEELE